MSVIQDDGEESFYDRTEFIVREGLCGDSQYVSLESAQTPDMFWRHQNYIMKLHKNENQGVFLDDSCFKMIQNQCSAIVGSKSVTFESKNFPGRFISKCGDEMKIDDKYCGDPSNGCWELTANMVNIFFSKNRLVMTASEKNDNVGVRQEDHSYQQFQLSRFRRVEGLAEQSQQTASFEVAGRPGSFLYTETSSPTQYRGCYRDNQTRVLETERYPGDNQNSREKCEELCRADQHKFFGVESG